MVLPNVPSLKNVRQFYWSTFLRVGQAILVAADFWSQALAKL